MGGLLGQVNTIHMTDPLWISDPTNSPTGNWGDNIEISTARILASVYRKVWEQNEKAEMSQVTPPVRHLHYKVLLAKEKRETLQLGGVGC